MAFDPELKQVSASRLTVRRADSRRWRTDGRTDGEEADRRTKKPSLRKCKASFLNFEAPFPYKYKIQGVPRRHVIIYKILRQFSRCEE